MTLLASIVIIIVSLSLPSRNWIVVAIHRHSLCQSLALLLSLPRAVFVCLLLICRPCVWRLFVMCSICLFSSLFVVHLFVFPSVCSYLFVFSIVCCSFVCFIHYFLFMYVFVFHVFVVSLFVCPLLLISWCLISFVCLLFEGC